MPQRQLHQQLREQLGDQWRDKLQSFEDEPLAAASIGQVLSWRCVWVCKRLGVHACATSSILTCLML